MTYRDERRQKQANTIKGEGNPNWKGGRIQRICVRCGSPFLVYPCRKDTQTHCSLKCANRDTADSQWGVPNLAKGHKGRTNCNWNGGKQIYICQWCGDDFKAYSYAVHKFCSKTCEGKYRFTGSQNPNWKNGITPLNDKIRKTDEYEQWRKVVYQRDDWTCQSCGKRGDNLHAHHIRPFGLFPELRFEISNGITLCPNCHRGKHSK